MVVHLPGPLYVQDLVSHADAFSLSTYALFREVVTTVSTRVKVTFRPNGRGIRQAGNSESIFRELERRADRVEALAQALYAPHRKTGDYGRGFRKVRTRIGGKAAVQLINVSAVAAILEHGSRPHVIEPKNKQALAWPGGRHPVKKVHHPGTPAYHIMRSALRAAGR